MIRRRGHDTERDAALYVSGEMQPKRRQRFEAHLLGCDDCWREVSLGREGRVLAEASREIAPPGLRDSVRAAVSVAQTPRRFQRRRLIVPAAALVAALTIVAALMFASRGQQPAPIAAALAATRTQTVAARGPSEHPAPDLTRMGLALEVSGRVDLAGLPSDAFLYRSSSGDVVALFLSDRAFPTARDAVPHTIGGSGWSARSDGMTLVCGDHPADYLVVAQDPSLVGLVEHALVSEPSVV